MPTDNTEEIQWMYKGETLTTSEKLLKFSCKAFEQSEGPEGQGVELWLWLWL